MNAQYSLTQQLRQLIKLANQNGLYDAADWVSQNAPIMITPLETLVVDGKPVYVQGHRCEVATGTGPNLGKIVGMVDGGVFGVGKTRRAALNGIQRRLTYLETHSGVLEPKGFDEAKMALDELNRRKKFQIR